MIDAIPFRICVADITTTYYQLGRLQEFTQWWHWLVFVLILLLGMAFVVSIYRRNTVELSRGRFLLLVLLRLAAVAGIIFFYLQLEKRTERSVVKNSRAAVLIDTSQSMSLEDAGAGTAGPKLSRSAEVIAQMRDGTLLKELRARHDVAVYRFDQGEAPIEVASLPRLAIGGTSDEDEESVQQRQQRILQSSRSLGWIGVGVLLVAVLFGLGSWLAPKKQGTSVSSSKMPVHDGGSYLQLIASFLLIGGMVVLATASLAGAEVGVKAILGLSPLPGSRGAQEAKAAEEANTDGTSKQGSESVKEVDWQAELAPRGAETRLGDALRFIVERQRGGPLAAIVVISDGNSNAGVDVASIVPRAADAEFSLHVIGVGSDRLPANAQVIDLEAPQRVFPGDKFTLTGYLKLQNLPVKSVSAQLFSSAKDGSEERKEDEQLVDVDDTGKLKVVSFTLTPEEQGTRIYRLRVPLITGEVEEKDNEKSAKVEIVTRKTKVLLVAGGPTREFIFLRNQLFRDKESTVDVLLQSARPGISQDANQVLAKFPDNPDDLFAYDCIVGFDPDWESLDELQIKTLERFVAEKAGGLIVVAGPVFTPQWSSRRRGDPKIDTVKSLYPVVFFSQGSASLSMGRFASDKPWPLAFTREGKEAQFLWLDDDSSRSERAWQQFEGVYGYYAVKDPKPGAQILARFSDPDTAIDGDLPVYLATQFFGSGRVLFQASGEMWRVRAVDDTYFEQYYTKLIRWATEGRLLRDSSRGVLLVDKDRCSIGDSVAIRAVLQDSQFKPLQQNEVQAVVVSPQGARTPLILKRMKDAARDGLYSQQITVTSEGDYRIELQVPGAADQLLVQEVRVKLPTLETERPQRNDPLLTSLASGTKGKYYLGFSEALQKNPQGAGTLAAAIEPRDQVTVLSGVPDRIFEKQLMVWLMGLICGFLCLEWLLRRLWKLA